MSPMIHNGNARFDRCRFDGPGIPLKFGKGSSGRISRSVFLNDGVPAIAYDADVRLEIVDTYASRLLDLTEGSITNFEQHLNYIAYEFISTVDYSRTVEIATHLVNYLYDRQAWVKWIGGSVAYDVAKSLVEDAFNINLPF